MSREPHTGWTNWLHNPDTIAGYLPLGEGGTMPPGFPVT